jgi:hypothetical protein
LASIFTSDGLDDNPDKTSEDVVVEPAENFFMTLLLYSATNKSPDALNASPKGAETYEFDIYILLVLLDGFVSFIEIL